MGNTLGYHRMMSVLIFGEESPATKYLEKKIKEHGEGEEVLVDEGQFVYLLSEIDAGRASGEEEEEKPDNE